MPPDFDIHALRRLIAATLSDGGMRSDIRYDPDRLAVVLMQRLACDGWTVTRATGKETDHA